MKELKTMSEVKEHFSTVRTSVNTQLCFKTALRNVEKIGKKNIPYPVLLPSPEASSDEFLRDLDALGYDAKMVLRNGIVLTFNKTYVPPSTGLMPSKGKKAKKPTNTFISAFLADYPIADFAENRLNMMMLIEKAWQDLPIEKAVAEFVYVSDKLAEEMDSVTDALLAG